MTAYLLAFNAADPDLFVRLIVGKFIATQKRLPIPEPFTFQELQEHPVDHEWAASYILYRIYSSGGDYGLLIFQIACVCLTGAILMAARRRRFETSPQDDLVALFLALWGSANHLWGSLVRSQSISFVFLPTVAWLTTWPPSLKRTLLLAAIFAGWTNIHGAYFIGLAWLACLLFREIRDIGTLARYLLTVGTCVAATALTPYGFVQQWECIARELSIPRPGIDEWLPADFASGTLVVPVTMLSLFVAGALRLRKLPPFAETAWIACATVAIFEHRRSVPILLFALLVSGAPQLASGLRLLLPKGRELVVSGSLALFVGLAAIIGSVRFLQISFSEREYSFRAEGHPENAIAWLRAVGHGGRLLVHFNQGSYVLWRLFPHYRISIDGRSETIYSARSVHDNLQAYHPDSPIFEEAISRIAPDYAIVFKDLVPAYLNAGKKLSARLAFEDESFAVIAFNGR